MRDDSPDTYLDTGTYATLAMHALHLHAVKHVWVPDDGDGAHDNTPFPHNTEGEEVESTR